MCAIWLMNSVLMNLAYEQFMHLAYEQCMHLAYEQCMHLAYEQCMQGRRQRGGKGGNRPPKKRLRGALPPHTQRYITIDFNNFPDTRLCQRLQ